MRTSKFKKKYPKASTSHFTNTNQANSNGWLSADEIQIASYYREETTVRKLLKISNGQEEKDIFEAPMGIPFGNLTFDNLIRNFNSSNFDVIKA